MTDLLVRLFIKDSENLQDTGVRGRYGTLAGIVGIVCNILLFAAKLIIGTVSKSVSITADAINNLSDASSSILTLAAFRISKMPPDEEHPYGHARVEYLSGLGVSAIIMILGYQLARDSIDKIIHPAAAEFSAALVLVLVLSIGLKVWMALFNIKLGKKIGSSTLVATGVDSRNDVIATSAVLVGAVVEKVSGVALDGYLGLLVALFILYSGFGIAKETIGPILGAPADEELVKLISDEITGYDERILGIHDLMVHDYGPGQIFASVHAEIDHRQDVLVMHEVIDDIEHKLYNDHHVNLVIHYDPVVTDDPESNRLKAESIKIIKSIDERLMLHDFRVVPGNDHTNLVFDVVIPYDMKGREKEIKKTVEDTLSTGGMKYYAVITFDASGFNKF